jgi:molybdenum cofactor cytidylyltransferase
MSVDTHPSSPVILLLAAGEGSRYGGIKQLADIAGEPMVRRVAKTALHAGVPVMVVTGAHADAVTAALGGLPVTTIYCEEWQLGMAHSIRKGVQSLEQHFPQASGVLLCLADQPLLRSSTLLALLDRHAQAPERVMATMHDDVAGPPVIFPRDCFHALSLLSGTKGARSLLEQEKHRVDYVACDDLLDVDTLDDLKSVQARIAGDSIR